MILKHVFVKGHGFDFTKASYEMVCNDDYFDNGCDTSSDDMKTALNVDATKYLNMYYTDCQAHGLFGFATFPRALWHQDEVQGVVNGYNTITGGDMCGTSAFFLR